MLIEQAIFTSAANVRGGGYQLVATSPGITHSIAQQLSVWGPSHDSLLDQGAGAASINFHPLEGDSYCVSKTTAAGGEYSARGGRQVYTQCLVVPRDMLARFGNSPFALLRAATAQGSIIVHDCIPRRLEPFRLVGRAGAVDMLLLTQFVQDVGLGGLVRLLRAALTNDLLGVTTASDMARLMAGLFNCLPVECRTDISFSTGLKFSARRPYRVIALPADAIETRRLQRTAALVVVDLTDARPASADIRDGWPGFIAEVLEGRQPGQLQALLGVERPGLKRTDLHELADRLRSQLSPSQSGAVRGLGPKSSRAPKPFRTASDEPRCDAARRADAPHPFYQRTLSGDSPAGSLASHELDPAQVLGVHCPEAVEQLELLDDAVFEAIAGKSEAFEQLRALWPQVLGRLGRSTVDESREQYLRHVLNVWRHFLDDEGDKDLHRAARALDVMCVLLDESAL